MIRNDEELAVVRRQLALAEDALASLRREVLPRNKRNYKVLSEGYADQIAALKATIRAYRGKPKKNGKGMAERQNGSRKEPTTKSRKQRQGR